MSDGNIVGDRSISISDGVARIATFVDWRDAPYNVVSGQISGITATTVADSPDVTLLSVSGLSVGQGLVIYGAGAPHAIPTPSAPLVNVQGASGSTTWEYKVVAQSRDYGCSAASSVAFVATANAELSSSNYNTVHMPYVSTGIHRWLVYGRRGGVGNFVFRGAVLANASADADESAYIPIFRDKSNSVVSSSGIVPNVAPTTATANLCRGVITAIAGSVVTLDVPAGTTGSGFIAKRCNLLGAIAAIRNGGGFNGETGPEIQCGPGEFHFSGNLRLDRAVALYGVGAGRSANAPTQFVWADGICGVVEGSRTADRWCPGGRARLGDRVMEVEPDNINTSIYECTSAGVSGTTEPAWNTTVGASTNDGTVVWTKRVAGSGQHSVVYGIRSRAESWGLPAEWFAAPKDPNQNGLSSESWAASKAVTAGTGDASYRRPSVRNGFVYRCSTSGTTGTVEPSWPLVAGATVTDGSVVWSAEDVDVVWGANWLLYARAEFENVSFGYCLGTCFVVCGRNTASMSTNANNWQLRNFSIADHVYGHGVYAGGSDANAGKAMGGQVTGVLGIGICDNSFLGNAWDSTYVTACATRAIANSKNGTLFGCHWSPSVYVEGGQTTDVRNPATWQQGSNGSYPGTAGALQTAFQFGNKFYNGLQGRNYNGVIKPYTIWGYHDDNEYFGLWNTESELTATGAALQIRIQMASGQDRIVWYPGAGSGPEMMFEQRFTGKRGVGIGTYRLMLADRNAPTFVRQHQIKRAASPWWGVPGDLMFDADGPGHQLGWTMNQSTGSAPAFATSTTYYAGDVVSDGTHAHAAQRTGKSGATAPSPWNATLGGTTSSGTVVFENVGPATGNRQVIAHPSPAPGTNLGNADATLQIGGGALRFLPPGTLTTNRVATLGSIGAENGQRLRVVREDTSPFSYTVGAFVLSGAKIGFVEHQYVAGVWRPIAWG